MNVLNPKVILFFLAFFPQFIDPVAVHPVLQMLVLGVIFMIQAFIIFFITALLADKLAHRLMHKPTIAVGVNVTEALIYIIIGISILWV